MDTNHLSVIINEIGSNLLCKNCSSKINISDIQVVSHTDTSADFSVHCCHCGTSMQVCAELSNSQVKEKNQEKDGYQDKKESQLKKVKEQKNITASQVNSPVSFDIKETIITKEEIFVVSRMVGNCKNLADLIK